MGQPLRLFFLYNLPLQLEAEDPTSPFGRRVVSLGGGPWCSCILKAGAAAGENGEHLQPMQCGLGHSPSPQPERVFSLEIENTKAFVTTHRPRPL